MENITGLGLIAIGGKERPIYFGFLQTRIFCQAKGIEYYQYIDEVNKAFGKYNYVPKEGATLEEQVLDMIGRMDLFVFADLIYSALVAGIRHPQYRETHQQDFTEDDVMIWVNDLFKDIAEFRKVYELLLSANKSPNAEPQAEPAQPETVSA